LQTFCFKRANERAEYGAQIVPNEKYFENNDHRAQSESAALQFLIYVFFMCLA
jgi:hypothetical protein